MKKQHLQTWLLGAMMACSLTATAQNEISVHDEYTGKDENIALPEGMTQSETDSLLREWHVRNYLTYDENCQSGLENPEYEKEDYIRRLQHLPNVIEMPYNDVVRKFIDQYSTRLRRHVSLMLGASNFYTPIFEQSLEAYQLPLELKYLPIIESALNPKATSRAGAVGLWQLMLGTGKQYGLEVTSLVDERRDLEKSTNAAAHYLKDLHDIFGDWTLVIAAYNCGPGNVNKAIKRADGKRNYWEIYPYLPQETRGYVPAFIAANYIMNYYCEHNICPVNSTLPAGTDTIMLNRDVRMEQIVDFTGMALEEIQTLNPQYRTSLIPGAARPCSLRLPATAINSFLEAGDTIYTHRAEELFSKPEVEVAVTTKATATASSRGARTVTVRRGDSLGAIAKRNGTTVARLRQLNGIRGNNIRAGQKIRVK